MIVYKILFFFKNFLLLLMERLDYVVLFFPVVIISYHDHDTALLNFPL